jgi:hypothetical protein
LIDEHELVAVEFDLGVQARNQVALDDDVVLFGPADRDTGARIVEQDFLPLEPHAQSARVLLFLARGRLAECNRRQHARRILFLPQHLVELVFARLAFQCRDVDLTHG